MYNPSYLVKSRHDVFYFRYPLPIKPLQGQRSPRLSISLRTRCPKEALRLANTLAYHSGNLMDKMDFESMNHADIMAILKSYYAEVLDKAKAGIDRNGPLDKQKVEGIRRYLEELDTAIADDSADFLEAVGVEMEDGSNPLEDALNRIMERQGVSFAPESREYEMLKQAHKFASRNYCNDLLSYNSRVMDFSLLDTRQDNAKRQVHHKPEHRLGNVITAYMDEIKSNLTKRSYNEQYDCLKYLTDWLGEDYQIGKLDDAKAREAKDLLRETPKSRNKTKLTAGKPLTEQIAIAKENGLETLGATSINKYLAYFGCVYDWAKRNRYITENPFEGTRIKAEKKKSRRRENFSKEEVVQIINSLSNEERVKHKSNYWGALIAVYTGARRNEIAGLLPDDVKQDEASGIWYFDITDEEEQGKELKTEAAKRVVPVHSQLIERGFLDFVEESRRMKGKIKHENGLEPRLLYDLTYTEHEKWGRNLGRWFNESYLKALGLKSKKKTLHSLRHSLITYLSAAGVDGANIKSIVGHEANTVTTAVYTHYGVDHLPAFKDAIEKLPY